MRWNALGLFTSIVALLLVAGCGLFGKKEAQMQTAEAVGDPYVAPAFEEPAQQYEPYSDEPDPTRIERSYPTTTGAEVAPTEHRYHVVGKQDTLYGLARMYYSDASRWKDIYEANLGEIENPDKIFVGQRLLIP